MRFTEAQAALTATFLLLSQNTVDAHNHGHSLAHLDSFQRKHSHMHKHKQAKPHTAQLNSTPSQEEGGSQELKRALQGGGGATCAFPSDLGLVAVTPGSKNGGWAMSPDQSCTAGSYCPYACPAGQVSMQWDPSVTSYTYPGCQRGGLYCNSDGTVTKSIQSNPYCANGVGTVSVTNKMSSQHAVCQTVLPGNEAMIIPTSVSAGSTQGLAVPDTSYWASTAAHYYHNPPGVSTAQGCIWGDGSQPLGNWSPYVSGANQVSSGNTFVKIGWNPIYTGESTFKNTLPTWGIRIECPGGGCNGLPCSIDPAVNGINQVTSSTGTSGAGGANFCVVTVASGAKAEIVVFEGSKSGSVSGSGTGGGSKSSDVGVITQAAAVSAVNLQTTATTSPSIVESTRPSTTPESITTPSTTSLPPSPTSTSTTPASTSISTTQPPPPPSTSTTSSAPPSTTSSSSSLPGIVFLQSTETTQDTTTTTSSTSTPPTSTPPTSTPSPTTPQSLSSATTTSSTTMPLAIIPQSINTTSTLLSLALTPTMTKSTILSSATVSTSGAIGTSGHATVNGLRIWAAVLFVGLGVLAM